MGLQDIHSLENHQQKLRYKLRLPAISDAITYSLFLLLWLAPTIRWRIEFGSFSFAFLEPVTLFVIGIFALNIFSSNKSPKLTVNSFILVLVLFFMWLVSARIWDKDWTHGLSDLRDWGIPILTTIFILSFVKHGWRKWSLIIIPIAILQSILGIYQHFTNSFRPFASLASIYKSGFFGNTKPAITVGFFEHPNSLAVFLIIAIILSISWLTEQSEIKKKLFASVITLFLSVVLYYTYAKAEIITLAVMLFLYIIIPYIRSSRIFFAICMMVILALFFGGWFAINQWPVEFSTVWWRVNLWQSVFQTLSTNPTIFLLGNGDLAFAAIANWGQPHNVFFDTLLNYGLIGLFFLLLLIILIVRYGMLSYKRSDLTKQPVLRGLYISIIGFFITGIVESSLIGIETRMIFLLLAASFIGFRRDLTKDARSE